MMVSFLSFLNLLVVVTLCLTLRRAESIFEEKKLANNHMQIQGF